MTPGRRETWDAWGAFAIYEGIGTFDWLDTPAYSALLDFSFISTPTNTQTGASCSVSWSFTLTAVGKKWKIKFN